MGMLGMRTRVRVQLRMRMRWKRVCGVGCWVERDEWSAAGGDGDGWEWLEGGGIRVDCHRWALTHR